MSVAFEKPVITSQPMSNYAEKILEDTQTVTIQPSFTEPLKLQEADGDDFKNGVETNEEELRKKREEIKNAPLYPQPRVIENHSTILCFSCYDPYPGDCCCCCCCDCNSHHNADAIASTDDGCCDCCGDDGGCCDGDACDCGDCGDCGGCDCDCC